MKRFNEIDFMSVQYDNEPLFYKESDFFDYFIKELKDPTLAKLNFRLLNFILDRFSKDKDGNIIYSKLGEDLMLEISRAEATVWKIAYEEEEAYQRKINGY